MPNPHYTNLISLDLVREYFPQITTDLVSDVLLQDMIDKIVSKMNSRLSIDIGGGPRREVTQTFKWEDVPHKALRLKLPPQEDTPIYIWEGDPQIPVTNNRWERQGALLYLNPGFANSYWYDRVQPLVPGFIPPVTVKYTPSDDFFRQIQDVILTALRYSIATYDLQNMGANAFAPMGAVTDDTQQVQYGTLGAGFPGGDQAITDLVNKALDTLVRSWQGYRIG